MTWSFFYAHLRFYIAGGLTSDVQVGDLGVNFTLTQVAKNLPLDIYFVS